MSTLKEIEDHLREGLEMLYADVSRKRELGEDRDKIQRKIDRSLGEWSLKLHEDEQKQIDDCVQRAEDRHALVPDGGIAKETLKRAVSVYNDYAKDIPVIREQMHHLRAEMIKGVVDIIDGREPKVEPLSQPQIGELHVPTVKGFGFTPDQITPENVSRFFGSRDKKREQTPQREPNKQAGHDLDDVP